MQRVVHSYKELTPRELNEKKKISKAFSRQFWKKQNKLNTPHMQKEDYLQVFSTATEILARIRCAMHLNFTLTGNATNFLLQMAEVPKADNDFLRNIVHEALKDSKGYVAKLTKESVDKFIDEHLMFVQKRESKRISDRKEMVTKVKETWNEAINNMDVVFLKRDQLQQSYSDLFLEDNSTHEPFIEDIAEKIVNLNDSLIRFKEFQHKRQLKLEKKAQNKKQKISSEKEASSSESTPTQEPKVTENNSTIENNTNKDDQAETPTTENKTEENKQEGTSTEEQYTTNEEPQQEDPNQKEIDEKVMITVQKVGESVEVLQEKLNTLSKNTDLHHLQEINELPFNEKKEKIKYLRTNTLSLAEKLSEHLFSLDQLVGSSEKVRPYKKKTVNQIQGILNQVDQVSEKLKHLESDLKIQEEKEREREERERQEQEEFDRKEREEFERILLEERSKREKERQEERERREREERERFLREKAEREKKERELREKIRQQQMQSQYYPPVHPSFHQQNQHQPIQKLSPTNSEREIVVNQRNQDNIKRVGNFPLPTREHWKRLKYEADFEIKKVSGKYHLQSFVPNLDLKELKILEKDNVLNISGTRYPTEQEEKQLIQKLLNWLKHYSSDISDWTENDFVRAILKVGSGSFGTFNVSYSLPDDYDPKKQITASYQRGVLEIEVPIIALQQKKFVHPFFANNFGGFDNFW